MWQIETQKDFWLCTPKWNKKTKKWVDLKTKKKQRMIERLKSCHIYIQWLEEEGQYIARCTEFKGMSAFGDTFVEACFQGVLALQGMIEVEEEDGNNNLMG